MQLSAFNIGSPTPTSDASPVLSQLLPAFPDTVYVGLILFFFFLNMPCDSVAFNRAELGSNLISEASEP